MVGKNISQYAIESELGHGGMGVVYLAADTALDRTVAIKFLSPDLTSDEVAKERFVREAKAAAAVEHDSICAIYEIGETDDGETYIVMPYYEGKTLKELIAEGPMDPLRVLDLAIQIGGGLAAAHGKDIVHRDIKPANVLITRRGSAKILDFGLAKLGGQLDLTKTRSSVGTVPYMAPEQIRGETIDRRTDIWALGAVMYEMLAGKRPFHGEYEQAVTYSILNTDPPPLDSERDDLPAGLADLVHRCLAKAPGDRYQIVQELLADIEVPSSVRPFTDSSARIVPAPKQTTWVTKAIGGIFGIVIIWLIYSLAWPTSSPVASPSERHLVILPFRVIGGADDADAEAYSLGLLETLTSSLTRLEQSDDPLWVVPSSEVNASMSIADAHRMLGANLVVTGSVQLEGERVRINLTLNDAELLRAIDSDQFDNSSSSTFAIQDEAVLLLSRMLQIEPLATDSDVTHSSYSEIRSANDSYLKAIGYMRTEGSAESVDNAIGLLRSAVDDDSLFALAHAALGSAYWTKYNRTEDVKWVDNAIQESNNALRLNGSLAEVHILLARIERGTGDNEAALKEYLLALEIDPNNAEAYRLRGSALREIGRFEDAENSYKQAIDLDPEFWRGYSSLGVHYYLTGDNDQAVEQYRHGLDLAPESRSLLNNLGVALFAKGLIAETITTFERLRVLYPNYVRPWGNLATAYFYSNRFEEAAGLYSKLLLQNPNDYGRTGDLADALYWSEGRREEAGSQYKKALDLARMRLSVNSVDPEALSTMAGYFAHLGEADSARIYLDRAIELHPPGAIPGGRAFGIGEVYLILGDLEQAKQWLEQGLSQNAGWMPLQFSPWLEQIRSDVDFMDRIAVYKAN